MFGHQRGSCFGRVCCHAAVCISAGGISRACRTWNVGESKFVADEDHKVITAPPAADVGPDVFSGSLAPWLQPEVLTDGVATPSVQHDIYAIGVQECLDPDKFQIKLEEALPGGPGEWEVRRQELGWGTEAATKIGYHGFIAVFVCLRKAEVESGVAGWVEGSGHHPGKTPYGTRATGKNVGVASLANKVTRDRICHLEPST